MTVTAAAESSRPNARRHNRFVVSWIAALLGTPGGAVPLRVADVSLSGLGVVSDDMLPTGTVLQIMMQIPGLYEPGQAAHVRVQARVVHQVFSGGRNRVGLEFVHIDPSELQHMIAYAQKRS
jgi:hypothetical protein